LLVLVVAGGFAFSADLMHYPLPLDGGNILVDVGLGWAVASASRAKIKIPPIVLSAEYCLPSIPISVGGLIGFYQYEWKSPNVYPWVETWTYVTFGARANWHWNIDVSWLDLYTGAFAGFTSFSWASNIAPDGGYVKPSYGGPAFGIQVGAHFYFSERVGAVAELGYPFVAKAGVALKF